MRGSSFYLLLCQLGLAATALGQETVDYSISEFDFIIPRPGVTYELGPDHRLPIVIAVQNATLWRNSVIDWTLNNYTLADSPEQLLFGDRFQLLKDGPEQQWLRYDTILAPSGTYHLDWNFLGRPCVNSSSLSYGFSFKTGPGGSQTSVRDAAKERPVRVGLLSSTVSGRVAVATSLRKEHTTRSQTHAILTRTTT